MATEQRERRSRASTSSTASQASRHRTRTAGPEEAARLASERIDDLLGGLVEGVSAVCRSEDGWRVDVDVLEVERIPDTTSLLATYEVELDTAGELLAYRRVRRYRRGAADD